jgi:hypothetical protein
MLDGEWNLILRACGKCNQSKAALEDRVSAASMHAPFLAIPDDRDDRLRQHARRKAQGSSGLRPDRGPQRLKLEGQLMPGVTMAVDLVAPPALDTVDVSGLAQFHTAAFFYLITYDSVSRRGWRWPGEFRVVNWSTRSDWGNAVQTTFASVVGGWLARFVAGTAKGYFQAAIRRDPWAECWSWALEWNGNYRVIGFCGDQGAIDSHFSRLPLLETSVFDESTGGQVHLRIERPLASGDNRLFERPESVG